MLRTASNSASGRPSKSARAAIPPPQKIHTARQWRSPSDPSPRAQESPSSPSLIDPTLRPQGIPGPHAHLCIASFIPRTCSRTLMRGSLSRPAILCFARFTVIRHNQRTLLTLSNSSTHQPVSRNATICFPSLQRPSLSRSALL